MKKSEFLLSRYQAHFASGQLAVQYNELVDKIIAEIQAENLSFN
jgi:hypothetical protein